MTRRRPRRDRQRGNTLLLALIVMSSLATLGSLTVVSVQSSLKASTNDRSQTVAMYAAETGGAAAMDLLRGTFDATSHWNAYVTAPTNLVVPLTSPTLPSSGALPGSPNNLFSADQNAWFSVEIRNNRNDPGYLGGTDDDQQVIVRSTGHGPQGSVAILEWEVHWPVPSPPAPPTPPPPRPQPLVLLGWHVVL
jgi:type II secretory pathway pseudopilin PulG